MKKLVVGLLAIIVFGGVLVTASVTMTDYEKVYQEFVKSTRADI